MNAEVVELHIIFEHNKYKYIPIIICSICIHFYEIVRTDLLLLTLNHIFKRINEIKLDINNVIMRS